MRIKPSKMPPAAQNCRKIQSTHQSTLLCRRVAKELKQRPIERFYQLCSIEIPPKRKEIGSKCSLIVVK